MRRLVLPEFGDPTKAPRLSEVETPEPGAGQLSVSMEASPINPSDVLLIRGFYGHRPELPAVLGSEGVGRVAAVGDGVDHDWVGKRVLIVPTLRHSTWQDSVIVEEADVFEVDGSADVLQLAMLGVNPHTADLLLTKFVDLTPGAWVGQTGGSSAVGRAVIALAKAAGYRTVSVVRRPEVATELYELGADAVVVEGDDLADQLKQVLGRERIPLLLDATAGTVVSQLAPWVAPGGTIVSYGGTSGAPVTIRPGDLIFKDLRIRGFWQKRMLDQLPREEVLESYTRLGAMVVAGTLAAPVAATYSLERHEAALAHATSPGRVGKVLFAW